ncbi:MAG: hypothetical protein ACOYX1_13360 [Acidobacteriota bacterium]
MRSLLTARPWSLAAASMAAIALWWVLSVQFAYEGHWNALFCTGGRIPMPEWLESRESLYRFTGSVGYDGQWFHVLAHRPLEFRACARHMDAPRLRVQRILLPLSAWLLAFGQFEWVDPAYYTLMLLWLGAGVWWTARLAELRGAPPLWGVAFLLLPSSMSGVDRMLSDGPLVAAAAGFFYFVETGRRRAAWILAALAPFIRETGLLLPAAACAAFLWQRQWRLAAAWTAAAAPFLIWLYSLRDMPGSLRFEWKGPFASALLLVTEPTEYPFQPWLRWTLQGLDLVSLAGFLGGSVLALFLIWRRRRDCALPQCPTWWAAALFAAMAFVLVHLEPRAAWDDFYSYSRVFSPIFLVLLLEGLERGRPALPAAVLALVAARMGLQCASPALRTLRAITGF